MTTPLPPHAIAVDHPNFPERHWTGFELAWIAARDKQFLAHSKQARADLVTEVQRLRETLKRIEAMCAAPPDFSDATIQDVARAALENRA